MIDIKSVLKIHSILIDQFGGSSGVRDMKTLDSAISRPYATFEGKELYPTAIEKSAAFLESIVTNHPFIDGNKRTGYTIMRLTLLESNYDIVANEKEKYDFVISISKGEMNIEKITHWIKKRIISTAKN